MTRVDMTVAQVDGSRPVSLHAMVDTGATFCMAPRSTLEGIGLAPTDTMRFRIATREFIERAICDAQVTIEGRVGLAPIIFGEENEPVLIGVIALERLSLAVDPTREILVPADAILYKATPPTSSQLE